MVGVLLLLLLVIGCLYATGQYLGKKIRHQETLFTAQAKKRKGQIKLGRVFGLQTEPTLLLKYEDYDLTVSNISDGTCAKCLIPMPSHVRCAVYQGLSVPFKTSEMHQFHTGNSVFDQTFTSESTDDTFLRAFLTRPIQHLLLRLSTQFEACRIGITSEMFDMTIGGIPDSVQAYDFFLDTTLVCLEWLDKGTLLHTIAFGTGTSEAIASAHTAVNPDISTLTVPPLALTHIIIDADSYDFYHVERFLTYAVNYIGSTHLKNAVDVSVYGNMENLHPNLRNSLMNLCKTVSAHGENDVLPPRSH